MRNTGSELNTGLRPQLKKGLLEMKQTGVVIIAFSVCIVLSFLIGAFLLLNVKAIPKYIHMMDTGEQVLKSVLEMQLEEKNYLLLQRKDAFDNVKDKIANLRKLHSFWDLIW